MGALHDNLWIFNFLLLLIVLILVWPPLVAGNEVPNAGPRGTDVRLYSMPCGNTSDVLGKSHRKSFHYQEMKRLLPSRKSFHLESGENSQDPKKQ